MTGTSIPFPILRADITCWSHMLFHWLFMQPQSSSQHFTPSNHYQASELVPEIYLPPLGHITLGIKAIRFKSNKGSHFLVLKEIKWHRKHEILWQKKMFGNQKITTGPFKISIKMDENMSVHPRLSEKARVPSRPSWLNWTLIDAD